MALNQQLETPCTCQPVELKSWAHLRLTSSEPALNQLCTWVTSTEPKPAAEEMKRRTLTDMVMAVHYPALEQRDDAETKGIAILHWNVLMPLQRTVKRLCTARINRSSELQFDIIVSYIGPSVQGVCGHKVEHDPYCPYRHRATNKKCCSEMHHPPSR